MDQLIAGSEMLGHGIDPFGDFNDSRTVGVICDTSAKEVPVVFDGNTYYHAKSVGYQAKPESDELVDMFTSRDEYEKNLEQKLGVEAKYGAFSGSFEHTFGSDYKSLTERTAVRLSYSSTLWTLLMEDKTPSEKFLAAVAALPGEFDKRNPDKFYQFFRSYGAFVVTEVTVGGFLDYAMLIDRSQSTSKTTSETKIKADYGVFFKGNASQKEIEEVNRFREHRSSKLSVKGGESSALSALDLESPKDCSSQFKAWIKTIPNAPKVASMRLTRIDAFAGDKRAAVAAALEQYLGGTALVESTWSESTIVLHGDQANAALGLGAPSLRVIFMDTRTLQMEQRIFPAPDQGSPDERVSEFWGGVQSHLKNHDPKEKMLLMATERWPRDARFVPPSAVRELMLARGARESTLKRWSNATQDIQPNPLAGVSYVLAGANGRNTGQDALAVGFGKPGMSLRPTAKVSVLLPRDVEGRVRVIADGKPVEDTNTELFVISSITGGEPLLGADLSESTRMVLSSEDPNNLGQYWYFYSAGTRYGWQPYVIINYKTCGVLQGKWGGGESMLSRFDYNLQDDVLWDFRGDDSNFHLLMLHYNHESWNQAATGTRTQVKRWRTDDMFWRRKKRKPNA